MSFRKGCVSMEKHATKTRPKSFPNEEILSSGSSDSGLESDNVSLVVTIDGVSHKSHPDFNFGSSRTHNERMNNLQNALDWVRSELTEMKSQDRHLARTMIDLRSKIQQLKLDFESYNDNGYDSDADESKDEEDSDVVSQSATSILSFQYMIMNGGDFEKNKRATWAM